MYIHLIKHKIIKKIADGYAKKLVDRKYKYQCNFVGMMFYIKFKVLLKKFRPNLDERNALRCRQAIKFNSVLRIRMHQEKAKLHVVKLMRLRQEKYDLVKCFEQFLVCVNRIQNAIKRKRLNALIMRQFFCEMWELNI